MSVFRVCCVGGAQSVILRNDFARYVCFELAQKHRQSIPYDVIVYMANFHWFTKQAYILFDILQSIFSALAANNVSLCNIYVTL